MAIAVMAGAALLAAGALWQGGAPAGRKYGEILIDGEVAKRLPLDSAPRDIRIEANGGFNIIRAGGGGIEVISADCPDHSCIRMGRAARPGDGAVCLPHKLSVRVRSEGGAGARDESAVDGGTW